MLNFLTLWVLRLVIILPPFFVFDKDTTAKDLLVTMVC